MSAIVEEIRNGRRFEFGKNWRRFLAAVNEDRIRAAESSLRELLELDSLVGKTFLDVGSGSGLSSLAARLSGAVVHSLDYDPRSVACTRELKSRISPNDNYWTVEEASVLDLNYMKSLPSFDIVYSWGVLHHTGAMWEALDNVRLPVALGGLLCVAIYNDEGLRSKFWRRVKEAYCSGRIGRLAIISIYIPYFAMKLFFSSLLRRRNPIKQCRAYKAQRGMSVVTDWLDWLGGLPFEVAKSEAIIDFYCQRGFALKKHVPSHTSSGNNQFLFQRTHSMGPEHCC